MDCYSLPTGADIETMVFGGVLLMRIRVLFMRIRVLLNKKRNKKPSTCNSRIWSASTALENNKKVRHFGLACFHEGRESQYLSHKPQKSCFMTK
jgi:hypothetical protein